MRDLETTARIRREDLTDLLELEKAPAKQRRTAEMPAVTLTNLLCIQDEAPLLAVRPQTPPPAELPVVTFRKTGQQVAAPAWPLDRWPSLSRGVVIALSASATLVIARLLTLL